MRRLQQLAHTVVARIDHLASAVDGDSPLPGQRNRLLGGLFLLCLIPRLVMAALLKSACNDAYYYISMAQDVERGQLKEALAHLKLNVYPFILATLHSAGLEWVLAGKLWGALVASLAVLPLFGLIRRLFDARIALSGCFLYAVHPGLIELSVEPIRDATFWCAFALGLYFAVRSVEGGRLFEFALFGLTACAAILTRSEGLLLVPAILLWGTVRAWSVPACRTPLAVGLILGFCVIPGLLAAANLGMWQDGEEWRWGRAAHFRIAERWVSSFSATEQNGEPESGSVVDPAVFFGTYFRQMTETIEAAFLLFLAVGFFRGRKSFRRPEIGVLLLLIAAALAGVMLYEWYTVVRYQRPAINGRYFYTVYLLALPFAGIGLLTVAEWLRRKTAGIPLTHGAKWVDTTRVAGVDQRESPASAASGDYAPKTPLRPQPPNAALIRPHEPVSIAQSRAAVVTTALVGLLVAIGWADAWTTHHGSREEQVQLGRWLQTNYGPLRNVVVSGRARRTGYYACGYVPASAPPGRRLEKLIRRRRPELVILSVRGLTPAERDSLISRVGKARRGSTPLERIDVPFAGDRLTVLKGSRLANAAPTNWD